MLYAEHLRCTVPYCLTAPTQLLFPAQRDRDRLKMQHTSGRSGMGAERVYLMTYIFQNKYLCFPLPLPGVFSASVGTPGVGGSSKVRVFDGLDCVVERVWEWGEKLQTIAINWLQVDNAVLERERAQHYCVKRHFNYFLEIVIEKWYNRVACY